MSAVFGTGVPISLPKHTNHPQIHTLISPKSSHFSSHKSILKSPVTRKTQPQVCSSSRISDYISSSSSGNPFTRASTVAGSLVLVDLDPATAKLAIAFLGPFLSAFGFLFIARIVMSWYPKLPVGKLPYVLAYAPTEPLLVQTRKIIPPLAGVDVTPVVWFGLLSFLNEILVGPQGLLVLLSQQQV
ncbi:LOW QUALITY PROTEIN: protein COFACTOR ASSEMBLY OF COMPLEX C SUBUNIT B CCB3, chloroplastic [Salvia miltiorrhiza]|uniref:LOW QUALITY PROTEIN: protein COFACTOR ASSEMBLY OF COMPLEX C SUBUNIT B CCB3, chloroplastic n=1 Tax=Salvia miltiorrhiza TaxID=226208 RepID=UPI0025AD0A01|nr:LOW QUALITY PROTEIN: protein COFACTOR ASSEMBLY OF COMPLEX C SUBUNIT B CCB3, chloroplastic [Salvia miltiorrhiza]